eukprot:gene17047-20308_t
MKTPEAGSVFYVRRSVRRTFRRKGHASFEKKISIPPVDLHMKRNQHTPALYTDKKKCQQRTPYRQRLKKKKRNSTSSHCRINPQKSSAADATVKTFESGRSVVNFRVAENESYKTKAGEKKNVTRYYDCVYWITPKIAQYMTKGRLVEMIGSVDARAYTAKDGTPRATLQMNASKIVFRSKAKKEDNESTKAASSTAAEETNDLPF